MALNLIEFHLTSAAVQTFQGQGSKCCLCSEMHPGNWSLGISSHLRKKPSKHSAFVDSVSPMTLFISLAITLGSIAAVCLFLLLLSPSWPMVPDFGSGYHSCRRRSQAAVAPLQTPQSSVFKWFCRLLLWWQVSKSTGAWVFHAEFGKALAKPPPGSAPVWSAPVALVGHLRRLCGMF